MHVIVSVKWLNLYMVAPYSCNKGPKHAKLLGEFLASSFRANSLSIQKWLVFQCGVVGRLDAFRGC